VSGDASTIALVIAIGAIVVFVLCIGIVWVFR
jgi:hypothetical protein